MCFSVFEFSFPQLIVVPLSCHEVDGVRKEKERLTAAQSIMDFFNSGILVSTFWCLMTDCSLRSLFPYLMIILFLVWFL